MNLTNNSNLEGKYLSSFRLPKKIDGAYFGAKMKFRELHQQDDPVILANAWDVPSLKAAEDLGVHAIGTSSAAIASMLGYEDGEQICFAEMFYIIKRLAVNTELPVSVDIEAGYSRNISIICDNIKKLVDLGIVGINLEDSIVDGSRKLVAAQDFANQLYTIKNSLAQDGYDIFMNARTDTFILLGEIALDETLKRIKIYEETGVDGVFVPCIVNENDILAVTASTTLPVNVMCMPNLPNFERLKQIGVKRISMGNFVYTKMYNDFKKLTSEILESQSFSNLF